MNGTIFSLLAIKGRRAIITHINPDVLRRLLVLLLTSTWHDDDICVRVNNVKGVAELTRQLNLKD
jgi:hypothetical protein